MTRCRTAAAASCARHRRRGAVLIYVMVLLFVLSLGSITLVRTAVAVHRQRKHDETRAQTIRLMEAGWNRALGKLARQPDYAGETWRVTGFVSDDRVGEVVVTVTRDPAHPREVELTVHAAYPATRADVIRATQSARVPVPGD